MALPELYANSPTAGAKVPITTLGVAVATTPAAGTVENWTYTGGMPAALLQPGQFRITIDGETCLDITGAAGNARTVIRGVENTPIVAHLAGAQIFHFLTAGALQNLVTQSQPPLGAFEAYTSAPVQIGVGAAIAKVALNSKDIDLSGWFDNVANYRFQPTVAGYYQFTAGLAGAGNTAIGDKLVLGIYKNGAQLATGAGYNQVSTGASAFPAIQAAGLIYLNGTTDYVELWGRVTTSAGAQEVVTFSAFLTGFMASAPPNTGIGAAIGSPNTWTKLQSFKKQPSPLIRNQALAAPLGVSAVQTIDLGGPTSGTFIVNLPAEVGGASTAAIAWNASNDTMQAAINAVTALAAVSVTTVAAGGPYELKFTKPQPVGAVTINSGALVGGAPAVRQTAVGVAGGPTLTRGVSAAATVVPNSQRVDWSDTRLRYIGARLDNTQVSSGVTPVAMTGSIAGAYQGFAIEFETDADQFDIELTSNGADMRVWVDDQPNLPVPQQHTPIDSARFNMLVAFGSRKRRRIRIELSTSSGAGTVPYFKGINLPKTATVWEPTWPTGPRVFWVGDSIGAGFYGGSLMNSWFYDASRLLGWGDIWVEAISGSGWTTNGGISTYAQRVPDIIAANPDIVVFCGSVNDGPNHGSVAAPMTAALNTLMAGLPNAKIIILGPYRAGTALTNDPTVNTEIKGVANALGLPFIDTLAGTDGPWLPGTGHVGGDVSQGYKTAYKQAASLTTDGPADVYSFDGTHPVLSGHQLLAARAYSALAAAVAPTP